MQAFAIIATCAALAGCAAESTLKGDLPRVFGRYDDRTVAIAPHPAACKNFGACVGLGAKWRATEANFATITVALWHRSAPITEAVVEIDGYVVRLPVERSLTRSTDTGDEPKASQVDASAPLEVVRMILAAKQARLRVVARDEEFADQIIDYERDSKAFQALGRFLDSVDFGRR